LSPALDPRPKAWTEPLGWLSLPGKPVGERLSPGVRPRRPEAARPKPGARTANRPRTHPTAAANGAGPGVAVCASEPAEASLSATHIVRSASPKADRATVPASPSPPRRKVTSIRDTARTAEAIPKDRFRPRHAPSVRRRSVGRSEPPNSVTPGSSERPDRNRLTSIYPATHTATAPHPRRAGKPTHTETRRGRQRTLRAPHHPQHPRRERHGYQVDPGTSREVRVPFDEVSANGRRSPVFRSQGFSPSQRFAPTRTWWPCFMPLPPIGFDLQSFSLPRQP
jgi:hypothetical protein